MPAANVTWTEAGTLRHKYSDVGVAVAVEGGLFTPIIRHAELKSLSEISNEMKDLAERARKRRLAPHEYQGGTTSISNLGMYGIKSFDAVINPPHATILAVGAGEKRPVVVGDKVEVATIDVLHAVLRPPGGGRGGRGRAAQRLQDADRGPRAHAGLSGAPSVSHDGSVAPCGYRRSSSTEFAPITAQKRASKCLPEACGAQKSSIRIARITRCKRIGVRQTAANTFGGTAHVFRIRAASRHLLLAGALLAGCAGDGSERLFTTGALGTAADAAAPEAKVDPACVTLASRIEGLRKEGIADKIEKAAAKKYKMTQADLSKADQLTKANAEFQVRCSTIMPRSAAAARRPRRSASSGAEGSQGRERRPRRRTSSHCERRLGMPP